MRVIANRTVTNTFIIPTNAPYAIDVYVQAKVPYADCLLGQGGYLEERCSPYRRVIDVAWVVHGKNGSVLRKGLSGGTCCDYTTDDHNHEVVSTMLGAFQMPAGTTASLELRHRRDVSKLHSLAPRIVIERYDPEESELGVQAWSYLGTGALLLIGLALLVKAWFQYRAAGKTIK
jgi:hypothetical protein